jgi:hypothetical protein
MSIIHLAVLAAFIAVPVAAVIIIVKLTKK